MFSPGRVASARHKLDALMVDTCKIGTIEKILNEETLTYEDTLVPVYEGPCRLRFPSTVTTEDVVAEQQLTARTGVLSVPVAGTALVRDDMTVVITSSAYDPEGLTGHKFRVKSTHHQTFATARRLSVEETT